MSRCSYCRCELPGLESLCGQCFLAGYDRVLHPEPWWQRVRLRFERRNFLVFCFLFLFSFAIFRFDFPIFRTDRISSSSTGTSAAVATLVGCIAFFRDLKDKGGARRTGAEGPFDWGRFMLVGMYELIAGVILYMVFRSCPMAVQVSFGLVSGIVVRIDLYDPKRTKSICHRLCGITGLISIVPLVAWKVTDQGAWLSLMPVCGTLMAGLLVLDRWEDVREF